MHKNPEWAQNLGKPAKSCQFRARSEAPFKKISDRGNSGHSTYTLSLMSNRKNRARAYLFFLSITNTL